MVNFFLREAQWVMWEQQYAVLVVSTARLQQKSSIMKKPTKEHNTIAYSVLIPPMNLLRPQKIYVLLDVIST